MTETEYITLSDDEEEPQHSSQASSSTTPMRALVTAHIGEVSQLDLSSIGITVNGTVSLSDVANRASYRPQPLEVSNHQNSFQHHRPVEKAPTLNRPIHRQHPYSNQRPPPYFPRSHNVKPQSHHGVPIQQPMMSSVDVKRMIEATDECNPKRRSTRYADKKKIAGQFVCTYNAKKCVKVASGTTQFITHLWTHVVNDYPETKERSKKKKYGFQYLQNDEPTCKEFLNMLCTCPHCNATFKSAHLKHQHIKNCHTEPEKHEGVCNICEKDFINMAKLKAHCFSHRPNEVPYSCRKCKYRTSARKFLYEHYIEKHNQECLMCPMCLFTFDLPTSIRNKRLLFLNDFVDHMREHSSYNHHCSQCALTFLTFDELETHKLKDHTAVPMQWRIKERKHLSEAQREKVERKSKIKSLQSQFFKTIEGKRVEDEVGCTSSMERSGIDASSTGAVLYICKCGKMKSYNGNRMASHFHRCRTQIEEEVKKYIKRDEQDDEEELKTFCVNPPFAASEIMTQKENMERLRKLKGRDENDEITREVTVFPPMDDNMFLKLASTSEEMEEYIRKFMKMKVAN